MAEFLVKIDSNAHTDLTKDMRGTYKRGDIAEVYPDGRCTKAPMINSKYYIIKMPGLTGVESYSNPIRILGLDADNALKMLSVARAKWKFDIDALTAIEQMALRNNRQITLDKSRQAALCIDKEIS